MSRIRVDDLHQEWLKDAKYRREYEALHEEFSLVAALIEARTRRCTPRPGVGQAIDFCRLPSAGQGRPQKAMACPTSLASILRRGKQTLHTPLSRQARGHRSSLRGQAGAYSTSDAGTASPDLADPARTRTSGCP